LLTQEQEQQEQEQQQQQQRVKLDFIEIPSAEVFPGQVIVVKGVNLYGKRLVVKELYLDASKPFRYLLVSFMVLSFSLTNF
jgi:hypothetical protein